MNSAEIRNRFLKYFEQNGHQIVPSSSLVPANDPTLLFTNAGMVQFKDVFLGDDKRNYNRATSSQRCVRAGGKHNDLDNVGYTARHHTFFEMLGNFSFGDYFKRDAIKFAWTFLTQELGLPEDRLWVTVHHQDKEAEDIWLKEMGISAERFSRLGDKDNFWSMGDTGPCGPCSEIFYDHGSDIPGGPPGSEDDDLDRYIEIWNLVFMQFNQASDGTRTDLPTPSVDTGMGMERIAAILQNVHTNYEIDIFQHLIKAAAKVTGAQDLEAKSLRVIADHIRSCSFLISDGVVPSNEGRGYVLRRIIRRAVRHGNKLGAKKAFFNKLVVALIETMGEAYPELVEQQSHIEKVLLLEEEQFAKTLDNGMKILESAIESLKDNVIDGETLFKLYDTYGFPLDLTADIARERNLEIDEQGFTVAMENQKATARKAGKFGAVEVKELDVEGSVEFLGYEHLENTAKVEFIAVDSQSVDTLTSGQDAVVVLDQTAFYAESGGQVGDSGFILASGAKFEVKDCIKQKSQFLHIGTLVEGELAVGAQVNCEVNKDIRHATALHHSATHLLHAVLRNTLGAHVQQKGSLCDSDKLRFDFSHLEAIDAETLKSIENQVNELVLKNTEVKTEVMDIEAAKNSGAMALFGEKYDDDVRVLTMGEGGYSIELCGGTHANRTGDIGLIKIVSESGIAAGVRRIEAVAGKQAMQFISEGESVLNSAAAQLKASREQLVDKVKASLSKNKSLEKEIEQLKSKLAASAGADLANNAVEIAGSKILAVNLKDADPKSLNELVDQLKNKMGSCAVVLAAVQGGKIQLAAGVTKDLHGKLKAGELVNFVAQQVGGKGGGKPDLARAGGSDVDALPNAIDSVNAWVESKLA